MPSNATPDALRVMSFNIRTCLAGDGDNAWPLRRECAVAVIEKHAPDLIGLQEAVHEQARFMRDRFPDYAAHGVGRTDGIADGEYALILYRTDRFDLLDAGQFWLSEQPDQPGSKSWDTAVTRIASWVKLHDRTSRRDLTFCNTHWDHEGPQARLESAKLLRRHFAGVDPLIVQGDLNCEDTTPPIQTLLADGDWRDAYRTLHPDRAADEATYHDFTANPVGERIDFIFHTAALRTTAAAIHRDTFAGRVPSDHFPITATLEYIA